MPLHVEVRGSGPPLVVLHGFTQTGRLWGRFGDLLAESHTLVAVDLPGHGDSGSVRADLPTTAGLVAEAVRAEVGDEPCALLGYSLGARVALHVALAGDLPLRGVVFIGVTAGIEDPDERAQRRRQSDDALADELEASGDVERFVDAWLRGPMFERLERVMRRSVRSGCATARPVWRPACGCAGRAPRSPSGTSSRRSPAPCWPWPGRTTPASPRMRCGWPDSVPHGVASLVPGGGHAVHLAQPEQAGRIVRHWLDAVEPGPA